MMAGKERAKLIDPDFTLDDWRIEEKPARPRPNRKETEEAAGLVGFKKRDAEQVEQPIQTGAKKPASIVVNRRRTGRTEQLNVRMTAETKAKFKSLADAMGWSEAVAFEKATDLLEKQCTK